MRLARTSRTSSRKPVRFFGDLLQGAQQKIGDQRHGDLDAHRVFRSSDELRDPERLLHQPEEQLDPSSALVEVGDFLGRRVEVIGEKPQGLAGLGPDHDLAHRVGHRVLAVQRLARGQEEEARAPGADGRLGGGAFVGGASCPG
jgi:hypothetical protein